MPSCPDCGEQIPEDGRFCPGCGIDATSEQSPAHSSPQGHRVGDVDPPVAEQLPSKTRVPVSEHKLLLLGVVILGGVGLFQGLARVLFAEELITAAGASELLSPSVLRATGEVLVLTAVTTLAVVVYYYRERRLGKWFFGLLAGIGLFSFFFAASLVLTILLVFSIYGFAFVLD